MRIQVAADSRIVMAMARLSAGARYRYLLRHTAAGDAVRSGSPPLAEYYAATGDPPGRSLAASMEADVAKRVAGLILGGGA